MIKEESASIGKTIFQIGIIAQSISYYTFCFLVVWAHVSVKKREFGVTGHESWWLAFWCIYASSVFIIVCLSASSARSNSSPTPPCSYRSGQFTGLQKLSALEHRLFTPTKVRLLPHFYILNMSF